MATKEVLSRVDVACCKSRPGPFDGREWRIVADKGGDAAAAGERRCSDCRRDFLRRLYKVQ